MAERFAGWNEIDVELVPSLEHPFSTNIISANKAMHSEFIEGFELNTNWHDYAIFWTPDYISWFLDGKQVRRVEHTEVVDFINKPCHLAMSLWTPTTGSWAEGFEEVGMPWYADYDYVETYTWNGNGFDLHWRDDFHTFDETRWKVANGWGYNGNSSTFYSSQVSVQGGQLHLKLEPSSWTDEIEDDETEENY